MKRGEMPVELAIVILVCSAVWCAVVWIRELLKEASA